MEIEKKFQLAYLPENLEQYPCRIIEQAYLCSKPTVRVRRSNEQYILTLKDKQGVAELQTEGAGIVNREIEIPLTKEAYDHLKAKSDGFLIEKKRYLVPLQNGLTAELDVFGGRLTGLYFAEVEFPDTETARDFIPPAWMGRDVSGDRRYRNTTLSELESYDPDFFV